jgi:hypothetical protein
MTTGPPRPPTRTRKCPRCRQSTNAAAIACQRCGVMFDEALRAKTEAGFGYARGSPGWKGMLAETRGLSIEQNVERRHLWNDDGTPNSFVVMDNHENVVFHAVEDTAGMGAYPFGGSYRPARPFTTYITALDGETAFAIRFPARTLFAEAEIQDRAGSRMGLVQRRYSVANSVYTVTGTQPTEKYEIVGRIDRLRTYEIRRLRHSCGQITRRWGGGRGLLSPADSFSITFPSEISPDFKAVFLGAVFLIAFECNNVTDHSSA